MNKVIVITGPTATGKSVLAVRIAKKIGGEIISADSRQVYRGLNIGTAKIGQGEMRGVSHHLLSITHPRKQFTVAEYKNLAEQKIKDIFERNRIPIICGGTGFYIDAVTQGLNLPKVSPDKKLRQTLLKKFTGTLFRMLQKMDPARARTIDPHNKIRLVRALEIVKQLGQVPHLTTQPPNYRVIKVGLYLPGNILKKKIATRVKKSLPLAYFEKLKN